MRKMATAPTRQSEPDGPEDGVKRDRKLQVRALESGTVVDHLVSGTALRTLRLLSLDPDTTVLLGSNLQSGKHGRKDIIKVEGRELTEQEINKVALLSPQASLSIIRNFEVVKKIQPVVPDTIEGLMHCVNPTCVTSDPRVPTRFRTESRQPLRLRCHYCERTYAQGEIDFL